jgi:glycosyltransferase involved in cell wall biosynthesis
VKVQCYMPVLNEADILPHTLRHLDEQGVSVHVIDGWSTDGSWEIAQSQIVSEVTSERFPADGPSPVQCCTDILHRIEQLAAASDADWILYSDADEWRRAPLKNQTLIDKCASSDRAGYNAIDFHVYQFYCVDGLWRWVGDMMSPERFFRYYDQADCISRIPNRKLWRNVGPVNLAGGGHEVTFPGMRIDPAKYTMKHYPFRTPAQAKAKIETRRARRCQEEHDKGWGVHYDQYPPDFNFRWDPEKLLFWRDTSSPRPRS